jgi:hypothetical protein
MMASNCDRASRSPIHIETSALNYLLTRDQFLTYGGCEQSQQAKAPRNRVPGAAAAVRWPGAHFKEEVLVLNAI